MDVEDAKKRLNFNDVLVRRRCVNKLVATISKKKAKTSANVKIPELNLLLDTCGNECYTTSMAACDGLLQLVTDGYLELGYAINNMLSSLSSSKNSWAMVGIVTKLVLLQMDSNAGKENLRSMQFPKHPLITILENKPNIWPLVLDSVIQAIEECPKSFSCMEPVISYMLMNPYNVSDHSAMHSSLLERLIPHFDRSQIANYFFKVLPWFQVFSFEKVAEVTCFLSRFKDVIVELPSSDEKLAMMEKLLFVSLALCHNCLKYAYDPTNMLKVTESIAEHLAKEENALTIYYNASLVSIPILLQNTSGSHTQQLLNIGHLLVRREVVSSIVAAMMMGPVVLLLAEPKEISLQANQTSNFSLTSFCRRLEPLACMQRNTTEISSELGESDSHILQQFTSFASQSVLLAKFCAFLDGANDEVKIQWLSQVKSMAIEGVEISDFFFHLVVGLFLSPTESENLFILYVEVFEALCLKERNNAFSTKMFALLLYKLKMETNPKRHFHIMEHLAKTVGHKYAVSPVLNVFRMMADQQELKAQAVYLMFLLCKKQERCFPYLQGMLTTSDKTVSLQSGLNEVRIAQAAVIKELCMENPASATQLLGALSTIINLSSDESSTPAVVLALDGVINLCKSEVIDLRSVWKNLSPKLCADKRSPVSIAMCRLLNLVPVLQAKSFEYEKFMKDTSAYLWRLISQSTLSPLVTSAAYDALSGYPIDCYNLKQLPEAAKVNLKLPASMVSTPFDMGKLPEDVLDYIPGYCFIDLLKSMEDPTLLKGYKSFLRSLISEEVSELPRSVYSRRKLVGKARNANNILSGIPCVLCSKKSSTIIQKDLAVGILLSYETPLDMDKEGKPTRQSVLNQLRLFEEVSVMLLNEVNLECNDWQRCLLLPAAWSSFMERAFFACEESRRASLDYQKSERKLEGSAEEIAIMYGTAWLWVRDRLLDLIKRNATKNNTASPLANSIFAVVGLVRATSKFYSELDSELKEFSKNCTKHPSHEVFQRQCTETILSAFDPQYRPSSKVFSWLLTHLPKQSTTSGAIVRGCAAASLYQLLPIIQKEFSAKIKDIFTVFSQHLMKDNPPTLTIYSGIGLGYFVKSICQTAVLDCHNDQVDLILSVVESLDAGCKIEEFVTGKLVALTLVVSGMCLNGSRLFIAWIENICESVQARLQNENKNSMLYEFVSICSSSILASATSVNLLPTSTLLDVATLFYNQQREMPQCSSTAISLAITIDSLSRLGEPEGTRMSEDIRKTWLGTLASERMPTLHRIAALNGLCSLFSSGKGLVQINKGLTAAGNITDGLKDLVQLMLQLLNATKNQSLHSICSWEMGRLFAVHSGQQDNSASALPSSYNYLSERSILKPLIAFLQETFPTMANVEREHVLCGLTALSFSFPRPLPPLHWAAFLTPFVKNTEDCEMLEACLKIVLYQRSSSTSALFLLVSYATPPLFHGLPQNCQLMLRRQIPALSTSLSQNQLQQFLQIAVTSPITNKEINDADVVIISQGILEAIKVTNSNQAIVKVLMNTLKEILLYLNTSSRSVKTLMDTVYEHIGTWPEAIQDLFLRDLENDECIGLLVLLLGYYIKAGKKPLTCLRHTIELGKHAPETSQKAILTSLLKCLVLGTTAPESDVGKPGKLTAFLLETMGWLTVLTDSSSKHQLSTANEVALFLFDICMTLIIGSASFFVSYTFWPETKISHKTLIQNLPDALSVLSCNSAWGESMNKVLDQLFSLRKSSFLDDGDRCYIQAAFCALRSSEEFRKPTLWTEIVPKAVPYV